MSSAEEKLRVLQKMFQDAPDELIEHIFEGNNSDIHQTVRFLENMGYSMNYDYFNELGSPSRSLSADEAALAEDMDRAIQSSIESYRIPSEEDAELQLAKKLSLKLSQTSVPAYPQLSKEQNLDIFKAAAGENPHRFCRRFIPVDKSIGGYIAGKKYCHLNRIKDDSTAESIAFVDQSHLASDVSCILIEATTDRVADRAEQLLHDHIAKLLPYAVFGGLAPSSRFSAAAEQAPNVPQVGGAGPACVRGSRGAHRGARTSTLATSARRPRAA
jgi:hypothetical protein